LNSFSFRKNLCEAQVRYSRKGWIVPLAL